MSVSPGPLVLCILDGLGVNPRPDANAFAQAQTPNLDRLFASSPHTTLTTHGEAVGLPAGQMGNSEVGHLNIGAGRVVEQWLLRISRGLAGGFLQGSKEWNAFKNTTRDSPCIHLIGLYSSGGVHSHSDHLKLLINQVTKNYSGAVFLHLFSDGRDTSPDAARSDISELKNFLGSYPTCKIASLCGRFFGMDRDKRWERTKIAWDAIALAKGTPSRDPAAWIETNYSKGITDEFLEAGIFIPAAIGPEDGVIFFNFRADRMRQIVKAIVSPQDFGFTEPQSQRQYHAPKIERVLCFTEYDATYHLPALFSHVSITNHLGEAIAKSNLKQLRVAETEKYPHVTYFFNGGVEEPYPGEERALVASPRDVKTYDLKPEMSAFGVTDKVIAGIRSKQFALIVVNFANCDMVGHTGVLSAAIKAVETVDYCLGRILDELKIVNGQALIFADHGNAEQMINYEDGSPMTSHTTFPVPLIGWNLPLCATLSPGALCDVAPTALSILHLPIPAEMTGRSLLHLPA